MAEVQVLQKKVKALLALTDAEQSKAIPKSLDTPKLVKVSKEVLKDIFNSVEKLIKIPATDAKPLALTDAEQSKAFLKSPDTPKPLPPIRKK